MITKFIKQKTHTNILKSRPEHFNFCKAIGLIASICLVIPSHAATVPSSIDNFDSFNTINTPTNLLNDSSYEEIPFQPLDQNLPKDIKQLIIQALSEIQKGEKKSGLEKLQQAWSMDTKLPTAGVIITSLYLKAQDYKAALKYAQKLQKNTPNIPEGYTLAGIAYSQQDNLQQAKTALKKALEVQPGDPEASRNLAIIYLKQEHNDKARNVLKNVFGHYPAHLQTTITLAMLEHKLSQPEKAATLLESAIVQHPDKIQPRILLTQLYLAFNIYPKALATIKEAEKNFPNQPHLMQLTAITYLKTGTPDKAVTILKSAIKLSPSAPTLYYNLALAFEQLKQYYLAIAEIDKALTFDPNDISSKFVQARLLAKTGQFVAAQKLITQLDKSNPENANYANLKGKIAIAQNKPENAIVHFKAAVKKNADNPLFVTNLALAQFRAKKYDAGYETLRNWINTHPTDISIRFVLADRLLDNGHYTEAEKYYTEILQLQPVSIVARNNLAWLLSETGQLDKALVQAEKNYTQAPENPNIIDTLATILLKKGEVKKATDLLQKATRISPNNTTVSYHLAQALAEANNDAKAKTILTTLLSNKKPFKERELCEELLKKL